MLITKRNLCILRIFKTISGYKLLQSLLNTELTHYFYGTDEDTLFLLKVKIEDEYPNAKVLGYKAPPFVNSPEEVLHNAQMTSDILELKQLKPDIIWIGISSPKQDYLMNSFYQKLDHGIMIGVGAVFLYMSGKIKKSPEWIKKIGLRWLYRMLQEPGRLIPFVLPNLISFVKLVLQDIFNKSAFTNSKKNG